MEIKSPKEMVIDAIGIADSQKREALKIKSKASFNGAFFGAGFGYLYANYKEVNTYFAILLGAAVGVLASNILTITKKEE
jgi:hypothetical protein